MANRYVPYGQEGIQGQNISIKETTGLLIGKLIHDDDPEYLKFNEDVAFNSPSAAASVIATTGKSGPATWSIKETNQTYREWKEELLKKAQTSSN